MLFTEVETLLSGSSYLIKHLKEYQDELGGNLLVIAGGIEGKFREELKTLKGITPVFLNMMEELQKLGEIKLPDLEEIQDIVKKMAETKEPIRELIKETVIAQKRLIGEDITNKDIIEAIEEETDKIIEMKRSVDELNKSKEEGVPPEF